MARSAAEKAIQVTFITKPGCHLCDEARPVLESAITQLRIDAIPITLTERNMLDDEHLVATYQEDIPVVLIDGKRHSYWHVDEERLVTAIRKRWNRGLRGLWRTAHHTETGKT